MNLQARSDPWVYQVTLGNKYLSCLFAIEVQAGKALQFSKTSSGTEGFTPPVLFSKRYTTFVINIEDITDNPELANGPKIYPIPLSDRESLLVLHYNPYDKKKGPHEIPINLGEMNKWKTATKVVLKMAQPKNPSGEVSQTFPLLPFGAMDLSKANGDFIKVWQRPQEM
jgi:hypothetical protein